MSDPLQQLLADGVIDAVVARLKSGKEADIWLVQHAGEVVAAKIYKDLHARSFHNNAAYKEGRQVRDTRTQRAMARGSRFGQRAAEEAWKAKESEALYTLHAAGVRVPRPVLFYEGVLLMEAVVDAEGHAAPRLVESAVPPERAAELYADLRQQVVRMLSCDLIHGDLSPYNVLLAWNGPTVIDFPQVVGAAHNSQAERFFERDLETIRRHFAPLDPAVAAATGDAREIWRAYVRRELTPDFVPSGKPAPEPQRRHGGGGERGGRDRGAQGQGRDRGVHGHGRGAHGHRGVPPSPPRGEGRGGAAPSGHPHHRPAHHGRGAPSQHSAGTPSPTLPRSAGEGKRSEGTPPHAPRDTHAPRGVPPSGPRHAHPARHGAPPSPPRGEGRGGADRGAHPPHRRGNPGPRREQAGPIVTYVNRLPSSPAPAPAPKAPAGGERRGGDGPDRDRE